MKNLGTINYTAFCLPLLVVACGIGLLRDYFFPSFQLILGVMIAPFVFKIKARSFSKRYLYLSVLFLLLYYFLTIHTFLFLSIGCLLFFTIEANFGKIGVLPFIFLGCISPALYYFVNVFTFDLRIQLSYYASYFLNSVGFSVTCAGNYFILPDGFKFNVDKACLGLNMFNTGLSLTILIIGLNESRFQKSLSLSQILLVLICSCLLLVVANFLRIITIVYFRSLPNTISHEMIGLFSMVFYMALPVFYLIRFLASRLAKEKQRDVNLEQPSLKISSLLTVSVCALFFLSFHSVERTRKYTIKDDKLERLVLPGYVRNKKEDGVFEFKRDSVLLYIKPACRAFESDHPPALCWKASGFDVEDVTELKINKNTILLARLEKDHAIQYTAWWYDNGSDKTTSQWQWRFHKGEPFRLINVTAGSKEVVLKVCREFLALKLF